MVTLEIASGVGLVRETYYLCPISLDGHPASPSAFTTFFFNKGLRGFIKSRKEEGKIINQTLHIYSRVNAPKIILFPVKETRNAKISISLMIDSLNKLKEVDLPEGATVALSTFGFKFNRKIKPFIIDTLSDYKHRTTLYLYPLGVTQ